MIGYFLLYIAIAVWIFLDARKRLLNGLLWAVFTAVFGPIVVPIYFAMRPLKEGEVREGGVAWNVLKNFALFWTITIFLLFMAGMMSVAEQTGNITSDAEMAGAGLGIVVGGVFYFVLWFVVLVGALVLGLFLKKSSVIERGPTGPLTLKSEGQSTAVHSLPIQKTQLFIYWRDKLNNTQRVIIGICVLVMLIIINIFIPHPYLKSDTDFSTSSDSSSLSEGTLSGASSKSEVPPTYRIGEKFQLGDFSYRVLRSINQQAIGGFGFVEQPSPGAIFVVVYYEIINQSNRTETALSDDFVLRDSSGREYTPSSRALTALSMADQSKDFLLSELQPGLPKQTATVFEIPYEAARWQLFLIVPEKGWGGAKAEVILKR